MCGSPVFVVGSANECAIPMHRTRSSVSNHDAAFVGSRFGGDDGRDVHTTGSLTGTFAVEEPSTLNHFIFCVVFFFVVCFFFFFGGGGKRGDESPKDFMWQDS